MRNSIQKCKKGGGRKFTDRRMSERKFKFFLKKEFSKNYSVKNFLFKAGVSRQTYYRFLNKYPKIKRWIFEQRCQLIYIQKKQREEMFEFLSKNPEKSLIDFYIKDIDLSL